MRRRLSRETKILRPEIIGKYGDIYEFEKLPDQTVEVYVGNRHMGNFKNKNIAKKYVKALEKHF